MAVRKFQGWPLLLLLLCDPADAALVSRSSGQAYYDDVLDITWTADAALSASNSFGVAGIAPTGRTSWTTANEWIAAMNSAAYLGASGWRLPNTVQPDATCSEQDSFAGFPLQGYGYGCSGSELGSLFYETLGNQGYADSSGTPTGACSMGPPYCVTNAGPFANLQGNFWSATLFAPIDGFVWSFLVDDGGQGVYPVGVPAFGPLIPWAVHDGDIAVVPVPPTAFLLGSGLAALWGHRRLRRTVT